MREGRLPEITHLQFLVLGTLAGGEQAGKAIRSAIAAFGVRRTGPAFYQMMARLERDGMVEGWYEAITVGDQAVKERRYRMAAAGSKALAQTRAFYEKAGVSAARQGWSNA